MILEDLCWTWADSIYQITSDLTKHEEYRCKNMRTCTYILLA